jgi:hypothetical protein
MSNFIGINRISIVSICVSTGHVNACLDSTGFEIVESRWILPGGDRGICRWTESMKALRVVNAMFGERGVTAFKERVGLGQFRIVVARPR